MAGALLAFAGFVACMEIRLAQLGYRTTIHDSPARWSDERARASRLGTKALILVGASRIQLGTDLDVLKRETGLEPVQLAIDGSAASMPILAGLAADPAIRGTIVVDYYDDAIGINGKTAARYQDYYERQRNTAWIQPSAWAERILGEMLHEHLLSYADEASPLNSLLARVHGSPATPQILTTLPNRSRLADYTLVRDMKRYYFERVARTLGVELNTAAPDTEQTLLRKIAGLMPVDNQEFLQRAQAIGRLVSVIEARGGRVVFIAMPSSGMIRDIEARQYPRAQFWDRFKQITGALAIQSNDHPELRDFVCPDGSHLDYRDREKFTVAMSRVLGLGNQRKQPD